MTLVTELDVPHVDLYGEDGRARFHETLHDLRAAGHWIVTTPMGVAVIDHDAVRDLQRDPRLQQPGIRMFHEQGIREGRAYERFQRSLISLQGAEHSRLRRFVSKAFTPRAVDRLRPMMRSWIEARADAFAARGGGDAMAEVIEPYPIAVICELVGAPEADWPRFSAWAKDIFRLFQRNLAVDLPVIEAAQRAMDDYVEGLIDRRRQEGLSDDVLSGLLRIEEEDGDRLSRQEVNDLVAALIMAGTDTTRNQLGLALLVLARHPGEWRRLVDDPTLARRAVEEAMRFEPTAATLSRLATEDVTYRGVTLPADSLITLVTASANRDPGAVECPMQFDVGRDRGAWSPLTFGSGEHYCLGASLARAELQEALGVLARRWPRVELTAEPVMKPLLGLYGPVTLPLRVQAPAS